jgi:hypothetical protein
VILYENKAQLLSDRRSDWINKSTVVQYGKNPIIIDWERLGIDYEPNKNRLKSPVTH